MNTPELTALTAAAGLTVGIAIGGAFGFIQQNAKRRHEYRQKNGTATSAFSLVPGSMTRVALFLGVLALVQVLCPLFFEGTTQWFVTAGVVLGYGWILAQNFYRRIKLSGN